MIANGQFILTTREAYEAAGTHSAVKHEVAEDLALAQTYLTARRTLYFAFADDLRWRPACTSSLRGLIEGWSKNVYLGGRRSFPGEPLLQAMVPVMLAVAIGFWLLPPLAVLVLGGHDALGHAALIATIASFLFWMLIAYGMEIPAIYRTRISAGSGNDALHRRPFSLARWTKSHLARSDVPELLASIFD